jgi:hypothetical protein
MDLVWMTQNFYSVIKLCFRERCHWVGRSHVCKSHHVFYYPSVGPLFLCEASFCNR